MGRKVRIAVTGGKRGSRLAWYFSRFLLGGHGAGGSFLHPATDYRDAAFDALLITGGSDIDPQTYGAQAHPAIEHTDPERDAMELYLLETAVRRGVPVMGICRGMQLLNLHFGGTLHPHIHDFDLDFSHPHTPLPLQTVTLEYGSRLHDIVGQGELRVNALHHQAVDRPGEGMRIVAHDRNRIVQAIEHTGSPFMLGLQWHPEFMPYSWHSRKIFAAFVHTARTMQTS
ncbi:MULTISPECIES: gamma-glutamyl-gamma-aminobutyrate hydrolase family protein [Sulfurimonas]|uniref:Gamma-glutamyl-gamma-aminobutyrate hydrolase family protein n=1 Tax=Sulfurimonas diazotrophicus TaxID=3131939 RepID=A0ABZ3HAP0_9BACT